MGNVRTWNHGTNGVWDSINSWDPVQFVSYPGADDTAVITIAGEAGPYWVEVQNVIVSVGGQVVEDTRAYNISSLQIGTDARLLSETDAFTILASLTNFGRVDVVQNLYIGDPDHLSVTFSGSGDGGGILDLAYDTSRIYGGLVSAVTTLVNSNHDIEASGDALIEHITLDNFADGVIRAKANPRTDINGISHGTQGNLHIDLVAGDGLFNHGLVEAIGQMQIEHGQITNFSDGTIRAKVESTTDENNVVHMTAGSILIDLAGTSGMTNEGTVESAVLNSSISISNGHIDQTSTGVIRAGDGAFVTLNNSTVTGGSLDAGDLGQITFSGNSGIDGGVNGISLDGRLEVGSGTTLLISDAIITASSNGLLFVEENSNVQVDTDGASLTGPGGIKLQGGTVTGSDSLQTATLTNHARIWSHGDLGVGDGSLTLVNASDGTISAQGFFLQNGTIVVDTGHDLTNNGTLEALDGILQVKDDVVGSGHATVDIDGILEMDGNFQQDVSIGSGMLKLAHAYTGMISQFGAHDTVDLSFLSYSTDLRAVYHQSGNAGVLTLSSSGITEATLHLDGHYDSSNFHLADDGSGHTAITFQTATGNSPFAAGAFGDFDNDHVADVLWQDSNGGTVATWQMNGSTPVGNFLNGVSSDWHILGVGDFDADQHSDVLWQNDNGNVLIWLMNDSASVGSTVGVASAPTASGFAGIGDFNGDGADDIMWRDFSSGLMTIRLTGGAEGTIPNVGTDWQIVGFGDFNGDGRDDAMLRNLGTQSIAAMFMNGTAVGETHFYPGVPNDWHVATTGDFDGNGSTDLFWHNDNGANAVWLMDANGGLLTAGFFDGVADSWHVAGSGDFTGDGKADLFWRSDIGETAVWQMDGTAAPVASFPGGVPPEWNTQAAHYDYA